MKKIVKLCVLIILSMLVISIGANVGYAQFPQLTNVSLNDSEIINVEDGNRESFQLHNPDQVLEQTVLNPFVSQTNIKILGDSITAGLRTTGYKLTNKEIGNTGFFEVSPSSHSWANMLKQYLETEFNTPQYINAFDSRIKANTQKYVTKVSNAIAGDEVAYTKGESSWTFTYTGTNASLYFTKHPYGAVIDLYVDGKKTGTYDLYSKIKENQYEVRIKQPYKLHHVEIKVKGKNKRSSGKNVIFEAVKVDKKVSVTNWGVSGRDSNWIISHMNELIEPTDDIVIIQIGTNDRRHLATPEDFKQNLRTILNKNIQDGREVILLSANPVIEIPKRNFTMYDVDQAISEIALEYGITYISNYQEIYKYKNTYGILFTSWLADRVHPSDRGQRFLLNNVLAHLKLN